jgi:RimJ/RimL family protein N-acetyltransferase
MRKLKKNSSKDMINPFLPGKNIYLRPVEITDAALIQKWHNDPELRKLGSGGELSTTKEKEEEDIKNTHSSKDQAYFMIVKKSDNKSIGFIRLNCLTGSSRNVWLRMIIGDKNSWGGNYASSALHAVLEWLFYELTIHRVSLETYSTNKRALRFFEKMGFKREGISREAHFADGRYYDIICFGLLKNEYHQKIK